MTKRSSSHRPGLARKVEKLVKKSANATTRPERSATIA